MSDSEILKIVERWQDPMMSQDLKSLAVIKSARVVDQVAKVELELGFFPAPNHFASLEQALLGSDGVVSCDLHSTVTIRSRKVQGSLKPVDHIKNVIAVASAKGGVGKSTTAVNLALALSAHGARVGVLDADIYGPSVPALLGLSEQQPDSKDGKTIVPLQAHGLQVMSMGMLVKDQQAMIWRGPMVTQALMQLFGSTEWQDLDYLIVDMPPGTGDIQLTLTQRVPLAGAVIVTTPQSLAVADARRGIEMFKKLGVNMLGIFENMSGFRCGDCGHDTQVFGSGGGAQLAKDYEASLLASMPLLPEIDLATEAGCPVVVGNPEAEASTIYRDAATRMAATLALQAKEYRHKFPNIVVEGK